MRECESQIPEEKNSVFTSFSDSFAYGSFIALPFQHYIPGMVAFYRLQEETVDILIVGNSHVFSSFDSDIIIVVLLKLLHKFDWKVLLIGCSIAVGIFSLMGIIRSFYWKAWNEDAAAIPAVAFVAMGMHDSGGNPGWYDGFGWSLFDSTGDDVIAAKEAAKEDIEKSSKNFINNPAYAGNFYMIKMNRR